MRPRSATGRNAVSNALRNALGRVTFSVSNGTPTQPNPTQPYPTRPDLQVLLTFRRGTFRIWGTSSVNRHLPYQPDPATLDTCEVN